ncbi:DUF2793 domain-containing protein [Xanthobacter dioxanivorans]|uniref:DUF2793 domain-containing protein n=1 Tax=Xanthobacter dioxanivorans TaxID=2528964 RepID=A0A974PJQ8_9HYPH|nr:DUF2793 domain-containing protein [Xanthobacter dioxanivorans]QRG04843.1 DUF2793 domain-containing protein [Xanthobacter dioxanivorans]
MPDQSANLALPYMAAAQAQKHVTHNEAIRRLDAFVQLVLESASATAPPASPPEGGRWFVPAGASGVFAGHAGRIAAHEAGVFDFLPVAAGFLAFIRDEGRLALFDGGAWVSPLAASPHGGGIEARVAEEDVVLSGAYAETSLAIPNRAIVLGVSTRTLVAVTGATSYDCGISGEAAKFGGSLGAAAGSTNMGVIGPAAFYAPTPVRLTANGGSFTGGTVRVALHLLLCAVPGA